MDIFWNHTLTKVYYSLPCSAFFSKTTESMNSRMLIGQWRAMVHEINSPWKCRSLQCKWKLCKFWKLEKFFVTYLSKKWNPASSKLWNVNWSILGEISHMFVNLGPNGYQPHCWMGHPGKIKFLILSYLNFKWKNCDLMSCHRQAQFCTHLISILVPRKFSLLLNLTKK